MKLRIGTRGSDLAMTQSGWVAAELARSGHETELVVISTSGDRSSAPSFGSIGPQGVFVREIEQALIDGSIDLAVHSFKDLPTMSPDALVVAAVPPRRDPADWLLYRTRGQRIRPGATPGATTPELALPLPPEAVVGTSSARRQAWLAHWRGDLELQPLRGNVPTRIRRLADGDFDAILLAGAGIERLTESTGVLDGALERVERLRLAPRVFVPAPAQGALAVQCRESDSAIRDALAAIDDPATRAAVDLERRALALAEGGCNSAFGAYAQRAGEGFELVVMTEIGGRVATTSVAGAAEGLELDAMRRLQAQAGSAA
jgi:hydroxymethylbilane synthase